MKKLILLLLLAFAFALPARIGITKNFYITDTRAFRQIQLYEHSGRFVLKYEIGGFITFVPK